MTVLAAALFSSIAALGPAGPEATPPPAATPSVPASAPSPAVPSGLSAEDREMLERIRALVAGRETEPAEKVFKNIDLLKGKPASRLPAMMTALTGLLGVGCPACHVPGNFPSDERPAKKTARLHFAMQAALNREYFGGANAITCFTCHRGKRIPDTFDRR